MQLNRLNKGKLLFLNAFLIYLALSQTTNQAQITSSNIKNPILKQYNTKKYPMLAETNVPIEIQQPFQIQPVYFHSYAVSNLHPGNCWFQTSAVKRNKAQYISFKKQQLGKFDDWDVQILDATYMYENQTLVGLFTNGSLFYASLSSNVTIKGQVKIQKIFNYTSKQTDQIWQLSQYSLYSSNNALYLLKQQTLYKISLNQQASEWTIINLGNGQYVKKVVSHYGVLYVLKFGSLERIQADSIDQNILTYQAPSIEFIDVAVYGELIYILDRFAGIIVASKEGSSFSIKKIYPIDRLENAVRINTYNNTILVTYLIHHKNFIAQIFVGSDNNLTLNKFYYRYERLSNLILYQKYAIGYSLNQMIIFQHSINRKTPIKIKSSQFLSKTIYTKIVDIIQLDSESMNFILVLNTKIYVQTLGQFMPFSDSNRLLHKTLKCTFQKVGNYSIETVFQGICKDSSYSSKDTYCKQTLNFQVQVHSQKIRKQQDRQSTHLVIIFTWSIGLVLVIGVILAYRKTLKEKAQKLEELRRRRANSQMISMQKDTKSEEQVK